MPKQRSQNSKHWKAECLDLTDLLVKAMPFAEYVAWSEANIQYKDTWMVMAEKCKTKLAELERKTQ